MSTQSVTATIIKQNVDARGLAIIVTNDYQQRISQNNLSSLSGTIIDGKNMKESFLKLRFAVQWEHNINQQRFMELIHEASNFPDFHRCKNYQCIVFVFSGHGDLGDIVYLQDGSEVSIGEGIIKPFLPKTSPHIGQFQKLFFFDACRGKQESKPVSVPKGSQPRGKCDDSLAFDSRGGLSIDRIRVPGEGGFLVAYSTMSNCLAWEERKGGAWLQRLAREITINTSSIEDVLTKVNNDMVDDQPEKVQQPEKLSRLNKVVFLHPDKDQKAPSKVKLAAVFPSQPTLSLDRTQQVFSQAALPPTGSGAVEDVAMWKQVTSLYPSASIKDVTDHPYNPPEYQDVTYYCTQVTVSVPGRHDVIGNSMKYFKDTQYSRNEAIKDILSKLQQDQAVGSQSASSDHSVQLLLDQFQMPATQCQPSAATPSLTPLAVTRNQGYSTSPGGVNSERPQEAISPQQTTMNYKQQMNQFFQENGIDPKYEYLPDALCFRCIVRYVRHGVAKEVDSVRYYTSKSDAKEQVAKLVLSNENVVVSKGSKGNTPPSKVWKSKLKEYCDKNRIVFSNSYQTVPSGNGFKSTVAFNGHVFEGEECKSKQEAEQSAAKRALQSV